MRIYYAMEAEGLRHHVRSALGVDAGAWNQVFRRVRHWRKELQGRYGIPIERELRACELVTSPGESPSACNCGGHTSPTPNQRAKVLVGGYASSRTSPLTREASPSSMSACPRTKFLPTGQVSLDRLFNRTNATAAQAGGHALVIFGHGPEETVTRLYGRLRNYNPVPCRPGAGSGGPHTRNLPIERVIGGPLFRSPRLRAPAPGGRPGGPRPALAGGVARWGNGRNQPLRRLRCPGPLPEPQGVKTRSLGGGQAREPAAERGRQTRRGPDGISRPALSPIAYGRSAKTSPAGLHPRPFRLGQQQVQQAHPGGQAEQGDEVPGIGAGALPPTLD